MDESTPVSRHPDSIRQAVLWTLLLTLLLVLIPLNGTYAQVATNITSTTIAPLDLGTNVDTVGSTTEITGGTRPGSGTNLFHSFDAFTLGTGETAHFLNDMQLPTTNIFGRVIGGEVSTIDGTLRTNNPLNAADPMNFGSANLWLVNPSGLLLGPNARIEVGGSVSMSTANYLRYEGTAALFDMLSSPASLGPLSVAPVAAFGFLEPNPAVITLHGRSLQVPTGQTFSAVGGTITLADSFISAPSGTINVVSVASPGEVITRPAGPNPAFDVSSFALLGDITLASNTTLDTSGDGGGTVVIRGGHLTMDRSTVRSDTLGSNDGARIGVDINIAGDISFINGGFILSNTGGPGTGGDINLNATDAIDINGGAVQSVADIGSTGKGGSITVTANDLTLEGVGAIFTTTTGSGNAGDLAIKADNATLNTSLGDQAFIGSATYGPGNAGSINLSVGNLTLNSTDIFNTTNAISSFSDVGTGNAGTITIQGITGAGSPASSVSLDNSMISTGMSGGTSTSTASTITITAQTLALTNGAEIRGDTRGAAPGGDITLNVDSLTTGGFISRITSNSFAEDATAGNAGNITIQGVTGSGSPAAHVTLDDSNISTKIFGGSAANTPATITITAHTLALDNGRGIQADTLGMGPAGDITLNVGTLTVANSLEFGFAEIASSSFAPDVTAGNAGNITIRGTDGAGSPAADVSLGNSKISTLIFGGSAASTPATITITARALALDDAGGNIAVVEANTVGTAPAGNIALNVGTLAVDNSVIASVSGSDDSTAGNAGNITIQGIPGSGSPAAHVTLDNGIISTEILGGSADSTPATITITAQTLNLIRSGGIRADTHGKGPAGDITLNVSTLTANDSLGFDVLGITSSSILTDATAGNAGNITIQGVTGSGSPAARVSLDNRIMRTTIADGASSSTPANITIAAHSVTLSNGGAITASTTGNAPAGSITLDTGMVTLSNGAQITTSSVGEATGRAGSITINAGSEFLSTNSSVTTEATRASGGDITLLASDMIRLRNSQISASVFGEAETSGGNITIDPQFVILQNSQIIARADAGSGGTINVTAGVFIADPASIVNASAKSGNSGTVSIQSPVQNVGGQLTPLPQQFSSAAALLLASRCAADSSGQFSSFVQTGRDGVPQIPGALSPSPLSFLETLTSNSLGSPSPNWAAIRLGLDSVRVDDSTLFRFLSACRS